jgi:hypothetical protein
MKNCVTAEDTASPWQVGETKNGAGQKIKITITLTAEAYRLFDCAFSI